MTFIADFVGTAKDKYPRIVDEFIQYGTAGFRTRGEKLSHVIYRMAALAVLRSKSKGATIGVMITASHNPEEDNGVKLVDPLGEMLQASWENHATVLANVPDSELGETVERIISVEQIDLNNSANVYFARDTRSSSVALSTALKTGIEALGSSYTDYELLTTPQLHYMVRCKNTNNGYGIPTEEGYYTKLSEAFSKVRQIPKVKKARTDGSYTLCVNLDAANGVGAPKIKILQKHLGDSLQIELHKDGSSGKLNHQCGADYVKVQQKAPAGIELVSGERWASFDGDADRIVFYYIDSVKETFLGQCWTNCIVYMSDNESVVIGRKNRNTFHLLDGDKIATLVAGYLKDLVEQSGLDLNLGLVQTAYANGSSTDYITNKMRVPVACVPTGVKHLHHKALEYDVGVYFEANGHGTVLFSDSATEKITKASEGSSISEQQRSSAHQLSTVVDLINQTVGDAISDLLLVETILHSQGWSIQDWDQSYTDLPNRQLKVKVKDRSVITTTDAERKAVTPDGLQDKIDILVSKYSKGRSFVRPSGTEDVVRVYAEADTQNGADMLAYEVSMAVYDLAGGVGNRPQAPS